jgi:hypothetical protein
VARTYRKENRKRMGDFGMRKALLVFVVACTFALPASALAATHRSTAPSRTSIGLDGLGPSYTVSGVVSSSNASCIEGRTVNLLKKRASTGKFVKIGTTTTIAGGNWSVGVTVPAGQTDVVRAVVVRHRIAGGACGKALSNRLAISTPA